jgi:hypothetical protein
VKAESEQEVRFAVLRPGEIKMKRLLPFKLLFVVLTIPLCLAAFAGEIEPKFAGYLETIGDDDFASAIIFLQDRPDIGALDASLHSEKAPFEVRHEQVFNALTQAAERSQPALLSYLDTSRATGTVRGYIPYWITNMVVVSATKAELERIANMDPGVDGDHHALTDRWRGNLQSWSECWRDALGGGKTYPDDYHGHGTHTMGTMCGAAHTTG